MRRKRPFTRAERISSLMCDDVARIVNYELRGKLAKHVEVTSTSLSGDLGHLKIGWLIKDDAVKPASEMLARSAGYVGRVLREIYQLRKTPKVVFHFDSEQLRLKRIRELLDSDTRAEASPPEEQTPDDAQV